MMGWDPDAAPRRVEYKEWAKKRLALKAAKVDIKKKTEAVRGK